MHTLNPSVPNPFAMLIDPQAVVTAMDRSDRLARLKRKIYRPLDKPLLARQDGTADYDREIDDDADEADDGVGLDG
ncbi:hypothetical protein [Piscinibacter sakaiensis]